MNRMQDKPPKIGPKSQIDPTARVGEISGRRSASRSPLVLGHHACVRSGAVLYAGTTIGAHFETGHGSVVREDNRIGQGVCIWNNSTIDYGCRIGNRVKIHCNVYVAQFSVIEDNVFIAPGVTFANDRFPGSRGADRVLQGPRIKRNAVIGARAVLLPGVVIGEGAMVGAGSVVTKDVPPYSVVAGTPARVLNDRRALRWPKRFEIDRRDARNFYARKLAGRPVIING